MVSEYGLGVLTREELGTKSPAPGESWSVSSSVSSAASSGFGTGVVTSGDWDGRAADPATLAVRRVAGRGLRLGFGGICDGLGKSLLGRLGSLWPGRVGGGPGGAGGPGGGGGCMGGNGSPGGGPGGGGSGAAAEDHEP